MKELLGKSKNNIAVYFDASGSHAATHFEDTPELKALVQEVVGRKDLEGDLVKFDTDMGRVVGTSDLVETDASDEIVYAKRKNRDTYASFTKSRPPRPCSTVAVSLNRQSDGTYELHSAWIGPIDSPSFPGDEKETPESKPFWTSHALVWGRQEIQPGTETTICPW